MHSTQREVEDFKRSHVWRDLKEILVGRVSSLRDTLEIETDESLIRWHQGRVQELRVMLDLPDIIIESIIDEKTRKPKELSND
tara:strand:- start:7983 stop:8231 length:249 start_codon:yes stop_codon:yes gene_type:complete